MKQFIKCPECGSIELATVDTTTIPWNTFIHHCSKCQYIIMESDWQTIPALSIKQPWAWLIVNGYKPLENRDTLKNFRGEFLIHASKKFDDIWLGNDATIQHRLVFEKCRGKFFDLDKGSNFDKGGIIGVATIVDSITESDSPWFIGPNAFVIENPLPLPFTPCKGELGFFIPKID